MSIIQFSWPDRRPIARLTVSSPSLVKPGNPNGWLFELYPGKTQDEQIAAYINTAIALMRGFQGCILWDVEGGSQPQYLGCPDLAQQISGESWQASFFTRFRQAGFLVGCCLRHGLWDLAAGKFVQPVDRTLLLYRKAAWARAHWKCRLFYIDSNADENGVPLPADTFLLLHKALPDCLFIPEHENPAYYRTCAPYLAMENGDDSPPPDVLADTPDAFGVVNINLGDIAAHLPRLLERRGKDIILVDRWQRTDRDAALTQLMGG